MSGEFAAASATPLRPLGAAEILDNAVRAVRRNARAAFTLSAPIAILRAGFIALIQLGIANDPHGIAQFGVLGELLVSGIFGTILAGLLAPVFTAELVGRRLTAGQSLRQVGRFGFGLVALALVVAVAQEVGLVVLVVGGVWLWGIWAVSAPVLVIERTAPVKALSRSFELVKHEFWRTWGVRTLRWVLTVTLGLFITLPFSLLASYLSGTDLINVATQGIQDPGVYVTVVAIGNVLSLTITTPISAAVDTLLYTDLRMRREGMDLVLGLPPIAPDARPDIADGRPAVTAW
ncbi:MAG: hypothetical protein QOH52_306 [Pseudonocardiales bacterium]|nr:hypothetical protein [Pseudonocardiales bacterium]